MNKKGKEWLKQNWYRPILHILPIIIFMIMCFLLLNIWSVSINNDEHEWNIFITVAIFGSLCWLTLVMIYFDKWTDYFYVLKKEYQEYMEK